MKFKRISEQNIYDSIRLLNKDFHNQKMQSHIYLFLNNLNYNFKKCIYVESFPDDGSIFGKIIIENGSLLDFEYETDNINVQKVNVRPVSDGNLGKIKPNEYYAHVLFKELML